MKRVYTTANGKQVNIDALIAQNESTIAVGNMKVNARGDQLGPGGKIEANKNQIMQEYYKLNTPVAVDTVTNAPVKKQKDIVDDWVEPTVNTSVENTEESNNQTTPVLRGSLADSVAKGLPPEKALPKKTGPSRI
jgi:hypothetical protein